MKTNERIELLSKFGQILNDICQDKTWDDSSKAISIDAYQSFQDSINKMHIYNGWYTKFNIIKALKGIETWLNQTTLEEWVSKYPISYKYPKNIGLIMAGNIPLVGFHDFLAVFISGNHAMVKLSSDDEILWPNVERIMIELNPDFSKTFTISPRLANFDAVIATGSNNSAKYFNSYFEKYPHIIRKNRTSIAVLNGKESKKELIKLGEDIFSFFGLGCRNVTQMFIPESFDINRFFEAIYEYKEVVNHNKYANNYDYNKAIYLLNLEDLLDNEFLLLRKTRTLHSPIGVLFYDRYEKLEEIENFIIDNRTNIQAVIGQDYIPFGNSQLPGLMDYADGVDTLEFLTKL